MNNELKDVLDEIFEDKIYDMCNDLNHSNLCKSVITAASQLTKRGMTNVTFMVDGYCFKINNKIGGFVSCSNDFCTGVSHTLYKPFPNDADHDDKERFTNLVSMMNEAYYCCVN